MLFSSLWFHCQSLAQQLVRDFAIRLVELFGVSCCIFTFERSVLVRTGLDRSEVLQMGPLRAHVSAPISVHTSCSLTKMWNYFEFEGLECRGICSLNHVLGKSCQLRKLCL